MRFALAGVLVSLAFISAAQAQPAAGPPAVGVVRAQSRPITKTDEFIGRIEAVDRVNLVARVTGFLDQRLFTEGAEVKQGDLLYRLERGPFEADVQQKAAVVAQDQALLNNATITLGRATALLNTPAGQRSTVDDARAQQLSLSAQLMQAQANLRVSQINLAYTEIHSPIDGKIGRTLVTTGNVVGPGSGTLATIVSQDPMYVTFPVSARTALDLRNQYADKGGLNAVVVKLRLSDGRIYGQTGKLNFVDNAIASSTDTIILRGSVANPVRPGAAAGDPGDRELIDGQFVTVLLEGVTPLQALAIPRGAVLSDQAGNYVFVVDAQNKVQQAHIQLGQSTPATAFITAGLKEGDMVVVDGIQRVRPGITVNPGPASPPPAAPAGTARG
jgi:membrane fusion protein (multidrug efflux system)